MKERSTAPEFAAALAVGVFVANLPVYPFQTALCLYLARRLHLNPLAVLAGSQISTPPVGLALIAAAIYTGHLLLHGSFPILPDLGAARMPCGRCLHGRSWSIGWWAGLWWGCCPGAVIVFCLANQLYRGVEDELETEDESEPAAGPINAPPEQVL